MKKIEFVGEADATTVAGELTVPRSVGLDTVNGKSLEPFGSGAAQVEVGGEQAGGAGYGLLFGAHVIETGGVVGYDGCDGGGVATVVAGILGVPHAEEAIPAPIAISSKSRTGLLRVRSGTATNELI
jgi:hypothetical protein